MKEMLRIPGLIDSHVHLRDPGETHKEDFYSGTCAALAGGVTTVIDMPNNKEPIISLKRLEEKEKIASRKVVCDYGFYFGATEENAGNYGEETIKKVVGLKMYLNQTHGPLLLSQPEEIKNHLRAWPREKPLLVHAEEEMVTKILALVLENPRPVHFCHISQKEEIEKIRFAKESGLPVTCEVTPHHLFLTEEDEKTLGPLGKMKPPLRKTGDVEALWRNLEVVDTIGSDHAPHTKEEKLSENPPFGVPGLETTLSLLLTAVSQGKLSLERLVELTSTNPAKIFNLKPPQGSWIEVDIKETYILKNEEMRTKCGWTPFEGKRVVGKIKAVYIRGQKVFDGEKILVKPGFGKEVYNG